MTGLTTIVNALYVLLISSSQAKVVLAYEEFHQR